MLGRSHVAVLVVALILASAGVAAALAGVDPRHPSPSSAAVTSATASTPTTHPSTTTTAAPPRVWSQVDSCVTAEADRPAVLSFSINGPQGPNLDDAIRLTKSLGLPTAVLERQGTSWDGGGEAAGTVGTLLAPARKLVAMRTDTLWTGATLFCAGHDHNTAELWIRVRPGTDPAAIAARHGFSDRVSRVSEPTAMTNMTTLASQVIEHVIAYLGDDDVLAATPASSCVAAAAEAASVPKLTPTSSTSTSSTSTVASTTSTTASFRGMGVYFDSYCGMAVR